MSSTPSGRAHEAIRLHPSRWLRLPDGGGLPDDDLARRHRQIVWLAWLHVLAVLVGAHLIGDPLHHGLLEALPVAGLALLASAPRLPMSVRMAASTLALLTYSAILVHQTGGLIEAHFHYFVVVVIVSLYQSWVPFLLGVTFVILHHGMMGVLDPTTVFNHAAAQQRPWHWAGVHGGFILAQSIAALVTWRVNEDSLQRQRAAAAATGSALRDLAEAQAVARIGSWHWDPVTQRLRWSDEMYRIAGLEPDGEDLPQHTFLDMLDPSDRPKVAAAFERAVEHGSPIEVAARFERADGQVLDVEVRGAAEAVEGGLTALTGTCQDVTEQVALRAAVERQAFHDPLTDLGNRAHFLDRLDHALARRRRSEDPVTVVVVDLDGFKDINDSLGHQAGDAILATVGGRIRETVRDADTVARLAGDEFAVLFDPADLGFACGLAERLRTAIADPIPVGTRTVTVQASCGVATADAQRDAQELLRDADVAMFAAKRSKDRQVAVFTPAMLSEVVDRVTRLSELQTALDADQFELHFQPFVDLASGEVLGAEALLRWNHPERGWIPPSEFVPVAERSGLIVPIGRWVVREAIHGLVRLRAELGPDQLVSINVSPVQLSSDLAEVVIAALERSAIPPRNVLLELTESDLVVDDPEVMAQLDRLRATGVRLAIDDFGTGYSSLGYLQQLAVDVLKIDRSFVDGVAQDHDRRSLVRTILELARSLGLDTVAEGIERPEDAEVLLRYGCDTGQGFYYARPVPLEELIATWADRRRPLPGTSEAGLPRIGGPTRMEAVNASSRADRHVG